MPPRLYTGPQQRHGEAQYLRGVAPLHVGVKGQQDQENRSSMRLPLVTTAERRVLYFWHWVGNAVLTLLCNAVANVNLTDMETGYKAFRRFGCEPELTIKVARQRWRMYEVGISYSGRTYEEGKKIGWRDGVQALWCIVKYGLTVPQKRR
jgi:hypothetical protein